MTTIADLVREGSIRLRDAGVPDHLRDARKLMEAAVQADGGGLAAIAQDPATQDLAAKYRNYIAARADRQPVSQIIGRREFWGRDFIVGPGVLDPRPETECLIEQALAAPFSRVLDMGVGSGAILVTLLAERPDARGVGIDIAEPAIDIAGRNADAHGVTPRITLPFSDWWEDVGGRYDLIVSNPPYIAAHEMADLSPEVAQWEPSEALTDGGDGLSAYRTIAPGALRHLLPGGRLIVEIGPTQGAAVAEIFAAAGFAAPRIFPDLDGRDRVVVAQRG